MEFNIVPVRVNAGPTASGSVELDLRGTLMIVNRSTIKSRFGANHNSLIVVVWPLTGRNDACQKRGFLL